MAGFALITCLLVALLLLDAAALAWGVDSRELRPNDDDRR